MQRSREEGQFLPCKFCFRARKRGRNTSRMNQPYEHERPRVVFVRLTTCEDQSERKRKRERETAGTRSTEFSALHCDVRERASFHRPVTEAAVLRKFARSFLRRRIYERKMFAQADVFFSPGHKSTIVLILFRIRRSLIKQYTLSFIAGFRPFSGCTFALRPFIRLSIFISLDMV